MPAALPGGEARGDRRRRSDPGRRADPLVPGRTAWYPVMVRQPGGHSAEDFEKIAAYMCDIEPRLAMFVIRRNAIHSVSGERRRTSLPDLLADAGGIVSNPTARLWP